MPKMQEQFSTIRCTSNCLFNKNRPAATQHKLYQKYQTPDMKKEGLKAPLLSNKQLSLAQR
jgi:hypothetical protein